MPILNDIYNTLESLGSQVGYNLGVAGKGLKKASDKYIIAPTPKKVAPKVVETPISYPGEADYISQALSGIAGYKPSGGTNTGSIFSAYDKEAEAQKQNVISTVANKRNDLLTGITRLREDIAKAKANQAQTFQGTRADLEESAFMANRANRASAASRGLSGSGLEQLAQLQNLMKSNKSISNAANTNIAEQGKLTDTLTRNEQDTNTNLNNLETEKQNTLNQIIASLTGKKASAAASAAASDASARNAYQQMVLQATQGAKDKYADMKSIVSTTLDTLKRSAKKDADFGTAYNNLNAASTSGIIDDKTYKALRTEIDKLKKK